MTVRVGFLGAGFITRYHVLGLATCGVDHDIVAVHDPDTARAAAFAATHGARPVGEDELFDLVDAVYVATWTSEHPRLVERAAAAGVAVFCEKPLAVDAGAAVGFDIYTQLDDGVASDNWGFASLAVNGKSVFYRINLLTGRAIPIGALGAPLVDIALPLDQ